MLLLLVAVSLLVLTSGCAFIAAIIDNHIIEPMWDHDNWGVFEWTLTVLTVLAVGAVLWGLAQIGPV